MPLDFAIAFAFAIDTPKIEFAPKLLLLIVPSNFIINWSILFWFDASSPTSKSLIDVFILLRALFTPLPW